MSCRSEGTEKGCDDRLAGLPSLVGTNLGVRWVQYGINHVLEPRACKRLGWQTFQTTSAKYTGGVTGVMLNSIVPAANSVFPLSTFKSTS